MSILQQKLDLANEDLKSCEQMRENLASQLKEREKELSEKTEQIHQLQATLESSVAQWKDKSIAQERLLKLYQEKHEDTTKKLEEAVAAQAAQAALTQQAIEEKERLIAIFNERYSALVQERDSLKNEVEKLQQRIIIQTHSAPGTPGTPISNGSSPAPEIPKSGLILTEDQLKARIEELVSLDPTAKKHITMVITL